MVLHHQFSNRGKFLKNNAKILRPAPNFLTAFSGEEVECHKLVLKLNFTSKTQSKSCGPGAIVGRNFQEIIPFRLVFYP